MGFFDRFTRKKPSGDKPLMHGAHPRAGSVFSSDKTDKTSKSEEKKEKKVVRGTLAREHGGMSHEVLVRPMFTEKSSRLETEGKYTFIVSRGASKGSVAQAVRDLFGVKPVSVRIANVKGKHVRFGRTQGREKDERKAIVTLKKGDSITVLE